MIRLTSTIAIASLVASACASTPANVRPTSAPISTAVVVATVRPVSPTPGPSGPRVLSGIASVDAGDHFYSPNEITVAVGTTVVWRVVGQNAHDIVARDRSFTSSALSFGGTFTVTFTTAGRVPYFCSIHEGDGMFGEVVVVPPGQ
jgi:plastocyanin